MRKQSSGVANGVVIGVMVGVLFGVASFPACDADRTQMAVQPGGQSGPGPKAPGNTPPPPPPSTAQATSRFLRLRAPAGDRPSTRSIQIDGYNAAILPNGRLVTPIGG